MSNDTTENVLAGMFLAYLLGVPISFGVFCSTWLAVNPVIVMLASLAWPVVALGRIGFLLGGVLP